MCWSSCVCVFFLYFLAVRGLLLLCTKPLSDCKSVKQSPISTGNSGFQVPVYSAHAATLQRLVITICSGLYILTPWLTFFFFFTCFLPSAHSSSSIYWVHNFFSQSICPFLTLSLPPWRHLSFSLSSDCLNLVQGPVRAPISHTLIKDIRRAELLCAHIQLSRICRRTVFQCEAETLWWFAHIESISSSDRHHLQWDCKVWWEICCQQIQIIMETVF